MPVYEFVCRECDRTFTLVLALTDYEKGGFACSHCHSKRVDHVWSHTEVITSKKS